MFNFKFLIISLLAFYLYLPCYAQISVSGLSTNVCPDIPITYTATGSGQCGNLQYNWNVSGEAQTVVRNGSVCVVTWKNTTQKGSITAVGTGSYVNEFQQTVNCTVTSPTLIVDIISLNGRQPTAIQANYSTNVPIGFEEVIGVVVNPPTISGGSNALASFFEWQYPVGWTVVGRTDNNEIKLKPSKCTGGVVRVRAKHFQCGTNGGVYYSDWSDELVFTRTIPTIQNFAASPAQVECGSSTSVGLSAAAVAGATSYSWAVPAGSGWAFANTPTNTLTLTTTTPEATLVPSNAAGGAAPITSGVTATLTANFGCGATQVATKTVTVSLVPINNMTFTSFPRNGLCGDNNFILTATTPTTGNPVRYRWTIGNSRVLGSNILVTSTPSLEVFGKSQNGSVTVSVVAENNCGGRSNPASVTFYTGSPEFTIAPIEFMNDPNTICADTYVTFFASVPPNTFGQNSMYVWNSSPLMRLVWARGQTATYQMLAANTSYTVMAGIQNDCGVGGNASVVYAMDCGSSFVPMRLFPNPAENSLTLGFDENATKQSYSYQIMNELGVVLLSGENTAGNNQTIDLQNLSKGVYYVKIITQQGVSQKRLVIEK